MNNKTEKNQRQPKWDIFEAAILLDGFLQTQLKTQSKLKTVKSISLQLRQMAINRGLKIDNVYRNENGISYQIKSMESAFKGKTIFVPATKLFTEIVALYNKNRAKYDTILKEAKEMIDKTKILIHTDSDSSSIFLRSEKSENIILVLKEHYQYGFRYDSIRELMRFRQFANSMGISFSDDDQTLKEAIIASGTVIEDKVFCKNEDLQNELNNVINEIFSSGVEVIYYEMLFEQKLELMISHIIISNEMLKKYLQKHIKGCSFAKKFMIKGQKRTEKNAIIDEIKRVWGESQIKSVSELGELLPYIPKSNIARVISGNNQFVFASEGKYLWIDKLCITETEIENICNYVEKTCEENGFASLSKIPLGDIEDVNYNVTYLTIINAIYKIALSENFQLNGRIITKNQSKKLNTISILKKYIENKEECTICEIADKVIEITGSTNRIYALQSLYDEMIRVDRNRFVANNCVNFNTDEIDSLLSNFVTDHFCAIRDVTTFAMFPLCGQNWNLYLLESFCYKYSRKYSIHVIHFNDKNSGIIAEKDYNKKYNELLAIELSRTNIELNEEIAGQYLFETGYLAKSKYSKLGEIVEQAKKLREER